MERLGEVDTGTRRSFLKSGRVMIGVGPPRIIDGDDGMGSAYFVAALGGCVTLGWSPN